MGKFLAFLILVVLIVFAFGSLMDPNGEFVSSLASTPVPAVATMTAYAKNEARVKLESTSRVSNLAAQAAESTAIAANATADVYRIQATQAAANIARESTAQAVESTRQVSAAYAQATQVAAVRTESAQATELAREWTLQEWTATAQAAYFAESLEGTRTAKLYTATAESISAASTARVATSVANSLELSERRAELVNEALAYAPISITAIAVLVSIGLIVMLAPVIRQRMSVILKDARGDSPIIFSGKNFYDPDRNPQPIATLGKVPAVPETIPNSFAETVSGRDQLIDYRSRGLPGASLSAGRVPAQLETGTPARPQYKIFSNGDRPSISQETVTVLDAEWKEAKE